jgi:hypothetical protein
MPGKTGTPSPVGDVGEYAGETGPTPTGDEGEKAGEPVHACPTKLARSTLCASVRDARLMNRISIPVQLQPRS